MHGEMGRSVYSIRGDKDFNRLVKDAAIAMKCLNNF